MTDRNEVANHEKLIEEAAKAIYENERRTIDPGWPAWEDCRDGSKESVLDAARDALAVFEKALGEATVTPTDDEREALIARLEDEVAYRVRTAVALYKGGHDTEAQVTEGRASVRKIAACFRRTEVPEPSAEPKHDESCAEWCNHCQVCGEGIRYGSRCREHYLNQVQAEPSDAQVGVALEAWYASGNWRAAEGMRAALRAAGGVR